MKKRNNFFWLCLVVLSLPFASCQKDQFPEGAIASGQSMQTINDVEAWSWSFLSRLRSFHNGSYYTGPEIQCDMVIPAYNYGNRGGGNVFVFFSAIGRLSCRQLLLPLCGNNKREFLFRKGGRLFG